MAAQRFQGGVDDSVEVPGKTTHQTLETVDVAPMAGVHPETPVETEEGENHHTKQHVAATS